MAGTRDVVRVLHVDDDPDFADLTATFLERHGERFEVETAVSADEGMALFADGTFDCVVSDYDMPGTDGIAFLEQVRAEHPEVPFVLFTGKGSEEVASEAIARGVTDYLQKGTGTERYELLANRIENAVEQYRARRRAETLDRIHSLHRDVTQALIGAETRTEILDRVCDVVSDAEPYRFAWIGEHDPERRVVEPVASAGLEDGYLESLEISTGEGRTSQGPTGRAVETRRPTVAQDIPENPEYEPWRQDALERGYRSSAAVPLVYDGTLYGVLNVYADRTEAFTDEELSSLVELGDNVAHALHRAEMRARQERYERIIETLPVGVYRVTAGPSGQIVEANPALADVFGVDSAEAMLDHAASDFYRDPEQRAALSRRLESEGVVRGEELRQVTRDGDEIWVSVTAIRTEENGETYFDGIVQDVTARKERERRLHRFESAVEHAGHSVFVTDADGSIRYVNGVFKETSGYAAEEAIGRTPSILKSGEHDATFYEELWETISDGEVWEGEVVNERKDGERYVVDQTIAPITGDGEITGYVAVNRDVSDRKEREVNLRSLKRAVDQAGIGIGAYDADGYPTYVNHRLAELFDTDRATLRTEHMADLDPELERDRFREYWRSFDDGERRIYDTRVRRTGTDEEFPAEIVTSRVTIEGEPYLVNTVRDVTDRRERERRLHRFESAVEHAGHAVIITDPEGIIQYVNDAFEETSGYSPAEAIGRMPSILKSGEHDATFYEELWETISDGEVWEGEVVNERKDGERYVVDQTIAPITGDGEITGYVAVNRDISDLKAYERELEAQNERLKQYGHTVAHDLRNPLNLLRGKLAGLEQTAHRADGSVDPAEVQEQCAALEDVAGRMERLVEELLAMAEHGQLVLDAQPVSLATAAPEAWEQVGTDSATLSVEGGTVDADPDRLRELLSNLFRNAAEHGGPEVSVRVGPLDFADGFFVEDDGPGIPEDERERVLERGFTTDADGTGFGLAIVEQIAEAHGWTVSITDGGAGGARFEFRVEGSG